MGRKFAYIATKTPHDSFGCHQKRARLGQMSLGCPPLVAFPQTKIGDFIVISTEARKRATAQWKEIMEKDFDIDYVVGVNEPSPDYRTAAAAEYAAYQLGQINRKLDRIIAALGSTN
jgi:hypothetical protein